MKNKLFIILGCLLINLAAHANKQINADSLLLQINNINENLSKINEKVENKYYTRIPNEDFENLLNTRIQEKVNGKFSFWIGLIIGFIALSGAGLYSLINTQIENKVKKASTDYIDESMNKRFAEFNAFIIEAKQSIFNEELERLQRRIDNNTSKNPEEYEHIHNKLILLLKSKDFDNPELIIKIVDDLARGYYFTGNSKRISEIIEQFEAKYDLTVTTLANAAISYTDFYELGGANNYKEMALKYCEEALIKNPVYGEPTSMKLIINMLDHLRMPDEIDKKNAYNDALALIHKVNSGSSYLWAHQTIKRLETDKGYKFQKYVDHLYELFPDEMKEMKTRFDEYEAKRHA